MPNHDGAAPRQVGAGGGAGATASGAAVSEVEVVQETLATADGVGPLLRGREREEEGYSDGGWGGGVLPNRSPIRTSSKSSLGNPTPAWVHT